ncbi:PucR family transcriptional regulator [Aquibacillus kalidii]|uniref:PucR family transcriptional regulator n=1 Tax=Aquibacillus kalidii TaxID=2762597 RepID=UPI0016479E7D|nr:PucR family transcriptional regulator [Aquibacillus kalidii]
MGLTAQDVIDLPILKTSKVKTSNSILSDKTVEWISVIETPVENFVRKNEFVLTTGIGCEKEPKLFEQFVNDIIRSGASVLAVATGRYIFNIPDRIIQIANTNELIVVDIPWEIRFGDVMQSVMHQITIDRYDERKKSDKLRQQLINCVLQDKGLQEIAQTFYRNIRIPLAITDSNRVIRANQNIKKDIIQNYSSLLDTNLYKIPPSEITFIEHPLYYHIEEYELDKTTVFQLPIINNHKIQGYLIFQPSNRNLLTWLVMNGLEHALTACALYFVKENAIELTEIKLKDNFVLNLAKYQTRLDDQSFSKARLLGYDLGCLYACIMGDIKYKESTNLMEKDNPDSSSLKSWNYYIQKEINYAGELFDRKTMTTFEDGMVIIFLEVEEESYVETCHQFLDTMERRLNALLADMELSWGVALQKDGEFPFFESYQEAKTALQIGLQQHEIGERTFFENTKINRLLMAISSEDNIQEIVKETLRPLIEYDDKRQTDLIYTFIVYNKYKGNVSQTARALNLHRQSLLYRLRNIEKLTNLLLNHSDDYFLLELCVRLSQLNRIE